MKKICFTGYRPFKLPFEISEENKAYLSFYARAKNLIISQIEAGNRYFISGMAKGADLILTKIILELKRVYEGLFLECAIPFEGQSRGWEKEQKKFYDTARDNSDKVTIIGKSRSIYNFMARNRYMVDNSDIVIAVYDGKSGGTKFTYDYAVKKGKQVIILNPSKDTAYVQTEIF